MGVDITFFAEHLLPDGTWAVVDDLVPNPIYYAEDPNCADDPRMVPRCLDIPRRSSLFAVPANVNNTTTSAPYDYIDLPRGMPDNASLDAKNWLKAWGADAFASSWLTLAEIDHFDWRKIEHQWFRDMLTPYERFDMVRFIFWFDR